MADLEGRCYTIPLNSLDSQPVVRQHQSHDRSTVGFCLVVVLVSAASFSTYFPRFGIQRPSDPSNIFGVAVPQVSRSDRILARPWRLTVDIGHTRRSSHRQFFWSLPSKARWSSILGHGLAHESNGGDSKKAGIDVPQVENVTIKTLAPETRIYMPGSNDMISEWSPVDDIIVGGSSRSSLDASTGVWSGTVSTNKGGFAGIWTRLFHPPLNLAQCSGIRLLVKGNGQRFKFIVRDDTFLKGISWNYIFETDPVSNTKVDIMFKDFVPTKRDKESSEEIRLTPSPTLNAGGIEAIQFAYSMLDYSGESNPKFEEGGFDLTIIEINTF